MGPLLMVGVVLFNAAIAHCSFKLSRWHWSEGRTEWAFGMQVVGVVNAAIAVINALSLIA